MSNLEVRNYIEDKIKAKFIKNEEQEWINVHIDANNKNFINIKIVSDHIDNRRKFKSYVKDLINEYPEYKIGTVRIYSVEEAEEYEIINNPRKNRPSNLVEAIDYMNNSYEINNNRKFKSEVISFYSYKGGVGRTLALIHTAYLLAQKGKNVLILDLDIEAPSMQNIFKSEMEEIDYGLIDYLYNRIYEKGTDKKITIPDIYVKIDGSKDENISGNLYVVPAGKLNTEYIYKLSKIQPNLVSRNNYISDLIKDLESKQELNLDFVLVDSRTGINDWGGLSLIDISDKVIFFVYPNEENMEGSKSLIDLVENSKSGNVSVVFSRVDVKAHDEAIKFYNELYEEFDLDQDYIAISYDPDIAISKEFPVKKMLGKCESIVDMILDSEILAMNRQLFENVDKDEKIHILEMLEGIFSGINVIAYDRVNRDKINEENIYLILSKSQDLLNKYTELLFKSGHILVFDEGKVSFSISILDNNLFNSLESYLTLYSWEDIWNSYIIKVINDYNNGIIQELKNKKLDFYLKYIQEKDAIELYKKLLKHGAISYIKNKSLGYSENIYTAKISILINNSNWLNFEEMLDCLEALKFIKGFFEKNNLNIDIKIFRQDNGDISNHISKEFKSNVLNLQWRKIDIENAIVNALYEAVNYLYERKISMFKWFNGILEENLNESKKLILNLFWGNKIVEGNKKISTLDYFCENLEKIDRFNVIDANEILIRAINIEKNKEQNIMNGQIISQSSLKKAFKIYLSNM
ncbi:MAG: tyrosine-protein kinase family protein [Intestinibacter sp.]|uniref:tyrosine-protein kinase family protein n=1 Tax=Intestinibacter sp. TaxID=1965304 RepID=UPI003F17317B